MSAFDDDAADTVDGRRVGRFVPQPDLGCGRHNDGVVASRRAAFDTRPRNLGGPNDRDMYPPRGLAQPAQAHAAGCGPSSLHAAASSVIRVCND
jgi:hypothetical protein